MSAWLGISFASALAAGGAATALIGTWPRRLSAEEWVLRRRAAASVLPARRSVAAGFWRPVILPRWLERTTHGQTAMAIERDLRFARLAGVRALPSNLAQFFEQIARAAMTGGVLGLLLGVAAWRLGVVGNGWSIGLLALIGVVGGAALAYGRLRRAAHRLRQTVIRRLPRVITGARMVMESGAATPEGALAMAASLYQDPATDLLRQAIRIKEVQKLSLEDALDQVAGHYGLERFGQLADAFRIGRRYGTRLSDILAGFAADLRREWHAAYRERITRAPVLMTIPALLFFVAPLLFLVLFLVFSPLFTILSQL